jgi:uncharacterized membrane protein
LSPRSNDDSAPDALPNTSFSSGSPPSPSTSVIPSPQSQNSTGDGGSKHNGKGNGNGNGNGKSKSSDSAISPGLIAGTVVLSIFLIIAIAGIVFYFMRKRLRRQRYLKERREIETTFSRDMMIGGGLSRNGSATVALTTPAAPFGGDLEKGEMLNEAPRARRFSIFTTSRSSFLSSSAEDTPNRRRRSFPSIIMGDTGTVSTIQFNPQTERQIALEERIWELEAEMNRLRNEIKDESGPPTDNDLRLWKLKGQIETLRNFKDSAWALGQTDDVPAGLVLG